MSVFDLDIDKQIKQHQQKIQELEALRITHEKKLEGVKEFAEQIQRLCNQNNLTEEELYVSRSEQIENWIVGMAKQDNPSSIYQNLRKHFARTAPRGPRAAKEEKTSSLPKPKLAVGTYEHPVSHQRVTKVKRNPRELDQWIEEFGFAVVRTWKKD
ncbi:hypothetical protein GJQ55_03920 [Venatoribacter cucullus]|uniref:Uncharacterized protein n=1 Tax=Venatoribacter cucullus TaxID=2661630 RepID=A0A9X7YNF1_9GAMM|nr:hypothetical protein [Venatoribacter cucullus]QQD23684.1 hypothetical protein GJQ55_03920 [Venatoribacter cucullus]